MKPISRCFTKFRPKTMFGAWSLYVIFIIPWFICTNISITEEHFLVNDWIAEKLSCCWSPMRLQVQAFRHHLPKIKSISHASHCEWHHMWIDDNSTLAYSISTLASYYTIWVILYAAYSFLPTIILTSLIWQTIRFRLLI